MGRRSNPLNRLYAPGAPSRVHAGAKCFYLERENENNAGFPAKFKFHTQYDSKLRAAAKQGLDRRLPLFARRECN